MRLELLVPLLIANVLPVFAADPPTEVIERSGTRSGLVAVVGAEGTALARTLAADGARAVDLLARVDEDAAQRWRAELAQAGRAGAVSVVRSEAFAALPYPDRFVNLVIADLDALGAAAPAAGELRRVVASYGALCLRRGGAWNVERVGLDQNLDEWSHFEHGADGNPYSRDRVVGPVRGLQWASYTDGGAPASTARVAGGMHLRAIEVGGKGRGQPGSLMTAREAGNGLLRWALPEAPGQQWRRSWIFEASWCVADGRLHGLVGGETGWGQAIDLATGATLRVYDQGVPAPELPGSELGKRQAEEERRWKSDVTEGGITNTRGPYSLGLLHVAVDGLLIQGGNPKVEGQPQPVPLGPTRIEERSRTKDEPQGPSSVTPAALYRGRVVALDAVSGARRWAWDAPVGMQVAHVVAGEGAVAVALTRATVGLGVHYRNRFTRMSEIVVLELASGAPRWRSEHVKDFLIHHMVIADGALFVPNHAMYKHIGEMNRLARFDLRSGALTFDVRPEFDNANNDNWKNRFAVFDGRVHLGGYRKLASLDARSGSEVKQTPVEIDGYGTKIPGFSLGHCSTWRATPNGWLSGRFARFIPFDGKLDRLASPARAVCDEGHYPAYGLLYTGYHPGCYCATYMVGMTAMHAQPTEAAIPDAQRLERGPAWGAPQGQPEAADQWPTMRASPRRDAFVRADLGRTLKVVGATPIVGAQPGGVLAQDWAMATLPALGAPVAAGGVALVAVPHERRLVAIDLASGAQRWSRPLAARLEYPPTIHRGLAYIGGNDGTVSCLRLSDGALVWRFIAAHGRRRIAIASQVESAWPVPGVVVHRDRLYAFAGRHNQLDGGLRAWCLDPATGAILAQSVIDGRQSNRPPFDKAPSTDFEARSNDLPAVDRHGRAVHMRDIAIDPQTLDWLNLCAFRRVGSGEEACAGFAESELPRLNTRVLEVQVGFYRPGFLRYGSAGLGIKQEWIDYFRKVQAREIAVGPDALVETGEGGAHLIKVQLDAEGMPVQPPPGLDKKARAEAEKTMRPALSKAFRPISALAMTPDRVVVAYPGTAQPKRAAELAMISLAGEEIARVELPADPLLAGLAVAGDTIAIALVDGSLLRVGTR